ncbi:putative transcriptional regulator, partial [Lactobacillus colini]|nr:putative transcriptional regulator [Lactobacillus colini]MBP2058518.1 putative transcriptional regulator [Lactobacillus colini]
MTKLTNEQRLQIYNQWKFEGISITQISKNWKLNNRGIAYMINLIDR